MLCSWVLRVRASQFLVLSFRWLGARPAQYTTEMLAPNRHPGRGRNFSAATIASFVVLSALGSLGYALNLFFITVLYTPMAIHSEDTPRHDALFAPKPAVYYVPIILSVLALNTLPTLLGKGEDITLLRYGYLLVPLFLAFAPQVCDTPF